MRWTKEQYDDYQARRALPNAKQRQREEALAGNHARETQGARCVPVVFTLYRVRFLDVDAKYSSVKDLLDCLVASGLVDGDQEGQVDLKVNQVRVRSRKEERTEIQLSL